MDRVIITGANGFIGRHLVTKLIPRGLSSLILIANTSNHQDYFEALNSIEHQPIRFYRVDIRDREKISEIFFDAKVDTCIHLAAKTSVLESINNPKETEDVNEKGTFNVLEACHSSGVNNFIFTSTAAVYGDVRNLPIRETQALRPLSPYGASKMLAEQAVSHFSKLRKIENAVILRIFNVYGKGQTNETDVITRFAARLSKGLPPVIYGQGLHTRDFISVEDVARAILLSIKLNEKNQISYKMKHNSPMIFNIGTGKQTSISDLADKMIKISGLNLNPVHEQSREDTGIILNSQADMTKSRRILGFVPEKKIEAGLKEILQPTEK